MYRHVTQDSPFASKCHELLDLAALDDGILGQQWTTADVAAAHKFVYGYHADIPEQIFEFGRDLWRRGLFRLPFPQVVMEFLCRPPNDPSELERLVLLCLETDTRGQTDRADLPDFITTIFPVLRARDAAWSTLEWGGPPAAFIGSGHTIFDSQIRIGAAYSKDSVTSEWANWAGMLCIAATVLLMSRSSARRPVEIPPKLARARERRGQTPLYRFTIVDVPVLTDSEKRAGHSLGFTRASPMLHWRRGHYRTLAPDRIVPVAPALVGSVEHGMLAKLYDASMAHSIPLPKSK